MPPPALPQPPRRAIGLAIVLVLIATAGVAAEEKEIPLFPLPEVVLSQRGSAAADLRAALP